MAALRGAAAPLIIIGVLGGVGAVLKPHILLQAEFYQRWEGPDSSSAQFGFHFDGDELFHVELDAAQTVWRLPEFGRYASFEAQGALQNMAVGKQNLDIMIHNSNRSQEDFVAPELFLFPMDPVDIDEPNVLICYADKFWPPVATLEWRRNGVLVRDGVYDSVYYGRPNLLYGKFSYLPFVPQRGDVYTCAVRHWAMEGPTQRLWEPEVPLPPSDRSATLWCAVGLALGIVGIAAGTALILRAVRRNTGNGRQRALL